MISVATTMISTMKGIPVRQDLAMTGSLSAQAEAEARVYVILAAETFKFAPMMVVGELIHIERRPPGEVLLNEIARSLINVSVRNPAFNVTLAEYIDLIVTKQGDIPPQMSYVIIRENPGWEIGEFLSPDFELHTNHDE